MLMKFRSLVLEFGFLIKVLKMLLKLNFINFAAVTQSVKENQAMIKYSGK